MMDLRKALAAYISERGFSQSAIASKSGIAPNKLCSVLKLHRTLKADELFALCDAMGISVGEFREYWRNSESA